MADAWIYDVDQPERLNGWIDFRIFKDVAVVQGAGVGGGSLIYANVFVQPNRGLMDEGWPDEIRSENLQRYYDQTGDMLQVKELPDGQLTERHKLMCEAAAACGHSDRVRKLPLAVSFDENWSYSLKDATHKRHSRTFLNAFGREQGTCVHCGNCDLGCPVGARNTLDLNYLALAEANGTEIRHLHLVTGIEPDGTGYRVRFDRLDTGVRQPADVRGERVILAAGSSTRPNCCCGAAMSPVRCLRSARCWAAAGAPTATS